MRYFEWDRLGLNRRVHDGDRIFKQEVRFELFKKYHGRVLWSAMLHKNMGLFYGNLFQQRNLFIEHMAKQLDRRFSGSAYIDVYDFPNSVNNNNNDNNIKTFSEDLEKKYSGFHYHGYLDSFEQFVKDVVEYRDEIRQDMLNKRMIEANDRKLQFILVNFDEKLLDELNNPVVFDIVKDLLSNSSWEHLFFVPLVGSAESFSRELHELFEWSAYLGSANDDFLHDLYEDFEDGYYSKHQMVLGSSFMKNIDELTVLHPLKFTPSKFANELEERFKTEDDLYEEFLNSLDDGS